MVASVLQVGSTLRKQWLSLGPVFQDQPEKAFFFKSFHHVTELFPNQCNPTVRSLWTGQHFSVSLMLLTPVNPSRIQIQNGASALRALSTRKLGSWPVTPTLPALFCALLLCLSLASVFLVPPVAHGYQGILCPETYPHPFGI